MAKRMLGVDVLTAARTRVRTALEGSERAYVSFSGGKDSTVLLDIVCAEARTTGRRVGILFVDLEAQYALTIDHVRACLRRHSDVTDPYWVALPLSLRNAVSNYEPQWTCWDPSKEGSWVRPRPRDAIDRPPPFFRAGMEFEDFVERFAKWYADGVPTACFVGIRSQESLNRWRTIASASKQCWDGHQWTTVIGGGAFNAYPIYDWATEDIWTYHARYPDCPSNALYDRMHQAGLTIHQQRICQPYGDDQRRGLWLYHVVEPETWGRVVARVNGANQGALYARERGNILGHRKVTRPDGMTWQQFAEMMLDSLPPPTAQHYRAKIAVFVRWWWFRGYESGIPDEADPKLEAARKVPSWRRVCKALLRNDYWCKGLSFSQHKSKASYARYAAILRDKRSEWEELAAPWKPSGKQLALIASLSGGTTPDHAWRTIATCMGISARKAKLSATRDDAARTITQLRANCAAVNQEVSGNECR